MIYEYKNDKLNEISIDKVSGDNLTIGYLTVNELIECYSSFGFSKNTVDLCLQPSDLFRSGVEVYDDYTFTELKIINISNVAENEDCVALYIKKNLFLVVEVMDYDNSIRSKFDDAIKRYAPNNTTLEKIIYAFLVNIISRDNQVIEGMEDSITLLEREVLADKSSKDFSQELFEQKCALAILHNYYEQILDITEALLENDNDLFDSDDLHYMSNITNKVTRLREDIDTLRSNITHLQDAYSTHLDLQMNKTMKVFTAVATIFLPLTLLTGWFGMNFSNMPSLNSPNGYLYCIIATVIIVIGLSILGKVKKWWG